MEIKINLNDERINNLILEKECINFTGYDINENGDSSPLTYSIYNNKRELFVKLLNAGVNINYELNPCNWSAMTYALRSRDDFFIDTLLNNVNLNHYKKVNGLNYLEHTLSSLSLPKDVKPKIYFNRLKKYIKNIDGKIKYKKYFSEEGIFYNIHPSPEKISFLLSNLPDAWLKEEVNKASCPLIDLVDNLLTIRNGKILINKLIDNINYSNIYNEKNFLQYYIEEKNNNLSEESQKIILLLLEKGFLLVTNKYNSETILSGKQFFINYRIQKNYEYLENKIESKIKIPVNKVKI